MSLTPIHRSDEVAQIGMWDGLMSGACAAVPSGLAVWYGTKYSPMFMKYTNYQSRTALFTMPPLFMFTLSSEQKITHRMREMAEEHDHTKRVSEWAEQHRQQREDTLRSMDTNKDRYEQLISSTTNSQSTTTNLPPLLTEEERERQLGDIYRKSVENSGNRVVPGDTLGLHHRVANFWQENPFKILTALSVPTIGYIFMGRQSKAHLQLQQQIMQTRVLGQGAVIVLLLTLMGFKGYMDRNGKFITETDALMQMDEMRASHKRLLQRLEQDKENAERMHKLKEKARLEMEEVKEMHKQGKKNKKPKKETGDILIADK